MNEKERNLWVTMFLFSILFLMAILNTVFINDLRNKRDLPRCIAELRRSEVVLEWAAKGLCEAQGIASTWEQTANSRECKK